MAVKQIILQLEVKENSTLYLSTTQKENYNSPKPNKLMYSTSSLKFTLHMRERHCMQSSLHGGYSRFVFGERRFGRNLDGTQSQYERSGRNISLPLPE